MKYVTIITVFVQIHTITQHKYTNTEMKWQKTIIIVRHLWFYNNFGGSNLTNNNVKGDAFIGTLHLVLYVVKCGEIITNAGLKYTKNMVAEWMWILPKNGVNSGVKNGQSFLESVAFYTAATVEECPGSLFCSQLHW